MQSIIGTSIAIAGSPRVADLICYFFIMSLTPIVVSRHTYGYSLASAQRATRRPHLVYVGTV